MVMCNPGIKTLRVAEIRRKSESTVWKQLNELRKKGIIEYRGSDRSGGYYVVEKKTAERREGGGTAEQGDGYLFHRKTKSVIINS